MPFVASALDAGRPVDPADQAAQSGAAAVAKGPARQPDLAIGNQAYPKFEADGLRLGDLHDGDGSQMMTGSSPVRHGAFGRLVDWFDRFAESFDAVEASLISERGGARMLGDGAQSRRHNLAPGPGQIGMAPAPGPLFELYGGTTGNCLRVSVALEVLGLDYVPVRLDLQREDHRQPEFLALNPFGQVPVLIDRSGEDGPLVLAQSNAILLHLCAKRPGVLLPEENDPRRSIVLSRFFHFVMEVVGPNGDSHFLRRRGADAAAELLTRRSVDAITASDQFLADGPYMAGQAFSLADVAAVVVVRANQTMIDWSALPHLETWFQTVMARDDVARGIGAFAPAFTE